MHDYIESTSVSFERKCAHHSAEKIGPLKWLMQWDMVDLLVCHKLGVYSDNTTITPHPPPPRENEGYAFKFIRKQFPIRLCYCNDDKKRYKGQTKSNVGVYLPQHAFSHGKLYVALTRGISMPTKKSVGHD
ncbi:hypothetical protein H5410_045629 [Solanum commersonii]|uniref:Uncharacterized protein n=1 Tax=Solanum commersonii TaxID=4109 RepID=A0A9J5XA39_SOLCO|nr:hypothetical protein H5410_045629 [Solanum commersonii]